MASGKETVKVKVSAIMLISMAVIVILGMLVALKEADDCQIAYDISEECSKNEVDDDFITFPNLSFDYCASVMFAINCNNLKTEPWPTLEIKCSQVFDRPSPDTDY